MANIAGSVTNKNKKSGLKPDDINKIIASGGALEGVEKAKRDGKIGFVGVSIHGHPKYLIEAVNKYPVETDPKLWTVRVRALLEKYDNPI